MTQSLLSRSRADTQAVGRALSGFLKPGDVVLISGPLGAGKSELARGVARGLGIMEPVTSPTFTLLNVYQSGRVILHHFDWYRIRDPEELLVSGLDEFIRGDWVTLIEWHGRAEVLLPEDCLEIALRPPGGDAREITLSGRGGFPVPDIREISEGGEGA